MATRQDKATTERHTRMLREMLKQPGNKVCTDCKRNDPRWASWNLGCFMCIRCSGIHRSMGTHISKVKSVDLDTWTPEQMENIQKWGNHRANLYWEAHLKPGHVPAEHKIESFIRSKYESRRWARDGPLPSDPSTLEGASSTPAPAPEPTPAPAPIAAPPQHRATGSTTSVRTTAVSSQPQARQLLSAQRMATATPPPAQATPPPAPAPAPAPQNDLFSLDFHAPAPATATANAPRKDVKNDILSLFSTPASPAQPQAGGFGAFAQAQQPQAQAAADPWGAFGSAPAQPQQQTSMMGSSGTGMWGVSSGWNAAPAPAAQQSGLWGAPAPAPVPAFGANPMANTNDVWGAAGGAAGGDLFGAPVAQAPKKDDVFGDIWGGFK